MSAWTEKYRPHKFDDIRGHRRIKNLFEQCAKKGCVNLPPIILYGPPGTGKTSLALALAKEAYPDIPHHVSTLYLNASDERSIEVIRERILQFTKTFWPGVIRRFVIFDEVETMTEPAQAALRALLDDVDREGHSKSPLFLFLCNSLYRVHTSIRSRCVALFCGHVPISHIRDTLTMIQTMEGIPDSKQSLPSDITFRIQRGDMRSFVAAVQYGTNVNEWDEWLERLGNAKDGKSIYVWEAGLQKSPFCILIRHIFLWLEMKGLFLNNPTMEEFLNLCLRVQDAGKETILSCIPPAWEKIIHPK